MSSSPPRFAVRIAGTGSVAPGRRVTTAEVAARVSPPRDAAEVEARTGIRTRYFAAPDDSPARLGADALRLALAASGVAAAQLERLVFVSSGGGDLSFPATANLVAANLGLRGSCDCFDVNNACMGFLTALDLAARSIATGSGPVGIAVADLPSRGTTPADPRPYLVFGDAAAAAVLTPASGDEGILGSALWNDGVSFGNVRLDNPTYTRRIETIRFTASNAQMGLEAIEAVQRSTEIVLAQAGARLADVRWVLPHQPNGALLDGIVAALAVAPERVLRTVDEVGSVGATSIALSLDRLARSGAVRTGDLLLMVGVGGGLSSGAVLYRAA
jgi:3-oxoacyl-(acyl-carrier-protein) synthase III